MDYSKLPYREHVVIGRFIEGDEEGGREFEVVVIRYESESGGDFYSFYERMPGLSYMRFGLMDYTLEQLIEEIDREFGHLKTFRLGYV